MAKLQIPLNGSNYTPAERKRAFQEALADGRKIQTSPAKYLQTSSGNGSRMSSLPPSVLPSKPDRQPSAQLEIIQQGVQHAVDHQRRTVDIHQQYLTQLREFQGIFQGLLDQQAVVLENGSGAASAHSLEVIQDSLAGFHRLQEKELEVHQQFLHYQAEYSHAFVTLLTEQYQQLDGSKLSSGSDSFPPPSSALESPLPSSAADQVDEQPLQPGQSPRPEIQSSVRSSQLMTSSPVLQSAFHLEEINSSLLEIVAEKTGYPAEMLDLTMDMEADLGIDSIKRVEILGALEDRYPELPPADTEILAESRTLEDIIVYLKTAENLLETDPPVDLETPPAETPMPDPIPGPEEVDPQAEEPLTDNLDLAAFLLETVAEKTGYPVEMLETSMDMEADLGIDSIKRVEILGAVEDHFPDLPPVDGDLLGEMRTLDEIITLMRERSHLQPVEEKKKPQS